VAAPLRAEHPRCANSAKALDEMQAKGITVIEEMDIAKIKGM